MAQIIELSDLSREELSPYVRLTEAQLRSRRDPGKALFIAESIKVISHALDAGYVPVSMLLERGKLPVVRDSLLPRCGDIPVFTGERELLAELTGFALTRGVLCAMRRPAPMNAADICRNARRVAVLEGIVDPTNVGAIFRSAAALGMDAVLLSPHCCDPFHRRAVRVSMGTVFQVPWAYLGTDVHSWPQDAFDVLRGLGFSTAAMALDSRAVSITDAGVKSEHQLAIFLGTEGDGLSPATVSGCDHTIMIPMAHGVDSLNVAAASAVAFWELRAEIQ